MDASHVDQTDDEVPDRADQVFTVVEDEQRSSTRQVVGDRVDKIHAGLASSADDLGHHLHQRGIARHGHEIDEVDVFPERFRCSRADFDRQSGLADSARPDQRDQGVVFLDERRRPGDVVVAADE